MALRLACPPAPDPSPPVVNATEGQERGRGRGRGRGRPESAWATNITFVLVGSRHFVKQQIGRVEYQPLSRLFAVLVGVAVGDVEKVGIKLLVQLWSRSWTRAVVAVAPAEGQRLSLYTNTPPKKGNSSLWCNYHPDERLSMLYESTLSLSDLNGDLKKLRGEGNVFPVLNHRYAVGGRALRDCHIRASLYIGTPETRCGGDEEPLETRVLRSIFEATAQAYHFHPVVTKEGEELERDAYPGKSTHSVGLAVLFEGTSDVGLAPYLLTTKRMRQLRPTYPFLNGVPLLMCLPQINAELRVRCLPGGGARSHLSAIASRLYASGLLLFLGLSVLITVATRAVLVRAQGRAAGCFGELVVASALDTWAMLCEVSKPSINRTACAVPPEYQVRAPLVRGQALSRVRASSHSAPAGCRNTQPPSPETARRRSAPGDTGRVVDGNAVWAGQWTVELRGALQPENFRPHSVVRNGSTENTKTQFDGGGGRDRRGRARRWATQYAVRWVSAAWLLLVINLNVVLKALLTAEMANPTPLPRVSSIGELLDNDSRLVIGLPSPIYTEFLRKRTGLPDHRLLVCADDDDNPGYTVDCEGRFDTDEHFAVIKEAVLPTGIKCLQTCNYGLEIGIRQMPLVLYVRRSSPALASALDETILRLHEGGIISWWLQHDQDLKALRVRRGAAVGAGGGGGGGRRVMAVMAIWDALHCLSMGLTLATAVFLLELCWKRIDG
ncbi:Mitotic checkpoint protein BUB3.2 [Frankliniella fusca]|uniref:Mitotic checkpoint protein BUB3.2 n=1 Tax=Frankliniella fusca TaxID=407009 RepID=A0AAE1HUQ2_9NEOP|nr:Mitotic checkpoint protein BUB3.2 [Frankliniella fusca]